MADLFLLLYRVLSNDTVMIHANLSVALLLGQLVLVTSDGAAKYMVKHQTVSLEIRPSQILFRLPSQKSVEESLPPSRL